MLIFMSTKISDSVIARRRADRARKDSVCCLSDMLLELMNEWQVEAVDIHRVTKIPHSTLHGYINYHVKAPVLNANILALAKFFNTSIEYLVFGIGEEPTPPAKKKEKERYFDQEAANLNLRKKRNGGK